MTLPAEDREQLLDTLRRVDPAGFRSQVHAVLLAYGEVEASARALGVDPAVLSRWIANDPAFAGLPGLG